MRLRRGESNSIDPKIERKWDWTWNKDPKMEREREKERESDIE